MTWGFLALALVAAPCTVPPMEAAIQAGLPYESFDTREGSYGWRSLNEAGCVDAVLALLEIYLSENETRLAEAQRLELRFHQGQSLLVQCACLLLMALLHARMNPMQKPCTARCRPFMDRKWVK